MTHASVGMLLIAQIIPAVGLIDRLVPAPPPAMTVCEVLDNLDGLNGTEVRIR